MASESQCQGVGDQFSIGVTRKCAEMNYFFPEFEFDFICGIKRLHNHDAEMKSTGIWKKQIRISNTWP